MRKVLWPPYRTVSYAIWEACARLGVRPPGVKDTWEKCDVMTQAKIIAFSQTSQHDDIKIRTALAGG